MTAAPAGHIVLHSFHALCGLDGNAACIERDALANQAEDRSVGCASRFVTQDNQARRFGAAASDTEQQFHLELRDLALVQHLNGNAGPSGNLAGAVGEDPRRENVPGFLRQFAGKIARMPEQLAPAGRRLQLCQTLANQNLTSGWRRRVVRGFVPSIVERSERQSFCDRLHTLETVDAASQQEPEAADATLTSREARRRPELP